MHDPTEPTVTDLGYDAHPAFGMISASRFSATPGVILFDSDIRHGHAVSITIETAQRRRDGHHDYIHGSRQLIKVELSEAQWASFVSSMNTSGVPCTIRATESNYDVPGLPYDPRLAQSMAEVKAAAANAMAKIKAARDAYEEAVEQKLGAKIVKERRRTLHYAIENAESGMTFAAKTLTEHTENVVQRARADIEAMVGAEAQRLGLTAGQAQGLLELPMVPGEESPDGQ